MDKSLLSLDELFAEARRGMAVAEVAKRPRITNQASAAERRSADAQQIYADPANWTKGRGIALVHATSQSLMGNFWEWTHNTMPGVRRLIRSAVPIPVTCVEEVDYGYYAEQPMLYHATPRAETVITATLNVMLDFPACAAAGVTLGLHFIDGYTSRVELLSPTVFVEGDLLLTLPAGTNILPVMNRATKLETRAYAPPSEGSFAGSPATFTNTRTESPYDN